jgi:hypothetical protein
MKIYIVINNDNSLIAFNNRKDAEETKKKLEFKEIIECVINEALDWELGLIFTIDYDSEDNIAFPCAQQSTEPLLRHPTKIEINETSFGLHIISPISIQHAYQWAINRRLINKIPEYKEYILTDQQLTEITNVDNAQYFKFLMEGTIPNESIIKKLEKLALELGFYYQTVEKIEGKGIKYFRAIPRI